MTINLRIKNELTPITILSGDLPDTIEIMIGDRILVFERGTTFKEIIQELERRM